MKKKSTENTAEFMWTKVDPANEVAHKIAVNLQNGNSVTLYRFMDASWGTVFLAHDGAASIKTQLRFSDQAMRALVQSYAKMHKKPITFHMALTVTEKKNKKRK